jgi:hypothetical protein
MLRDCTLIYGQNPHLPDRVNGRIPGGCLYPQYSGLNLAKLASKYGLIPTCFKFVHFLPNCGILLLSIIYLEEKERLKRGFNSAATSPFCKSGFLAGFCGDVVMSVKRDAGVKDFVGPGGFALFYGTGFLSYQGEGSCNNFCHKNPPLDTRLSESIVLNLK